VGARGVFNQPYEPLLFDVARIPYPGLGAAEDTLGSLEAACRAGDAAALIVEPLVLGSGGMLFYSPEILAAMREICARYGVLFIADEVMTGWGRTGTLLACEQAGVVPDILCLSKGLTGGALPLAVTMATEPIFQAHWSTDRAKMFFHSSSYTANPIACAAAAANLAIWREEPVRECVADLARRQSAWLEKLSRFCHFDNGRVLGTIAALDIRTQGGGGYMDGLAPELMAFFRERDVLLRPLGNTVYVMPPYCITDDQLDEVWNAIGEAVISF
jgi:adenosylmethionine-8-amino-7-oxononanoate aminotransferase